MIQIFKMKIQVKLLATYRKKLPPDAKGNTCTLELPDGSGVVAVLEHFGISNDNSNVVLVNGLSHDYPPQLVDGDTITIFSAMAGG